MMSSGSLATRVSRLSYRARTSKCYSQAYLSKGKLQSAHVSAQTLWAGQMEQPSCQQAQWKEEQLKLQNELPTSFSQQQQTTTASAAATVHFWVDVMVNQSTSAWLSLLELLKSLWAASWNAAVDAGDATNQLSQALSVSPHTLPISSVQLSDEPIANISDNAGCSAHCSILSATETPNLTAVGTTVPRPYASMAIFLLAAFLGLPHAWEAVKRKRQRSMEEQAILAANGRNLLKQKKRMQRVLVYEYELPALQDSKAAADAAERAPSVRRGAERPLAGPPGDVEMPREMHRQWDKFMHQAKVVQVQNVVSTRQHRQTNSSGAPASVDKQALADMTERFRHADEHATSMKEYVSFDQLYGDEEDPEAARAQRVADRKARWGGSADPSQSAVAGTPMAGSSTTKASNPSQRGSSASVAPRRATAPASETLAQRQAALQAALQAPNPFARGLSIQARDGGAAVHGGNDEQQAAARTKRTCLGSAQDEGISRAGDARPMPTAAQQAKLRQEVLGMTPTEQARAYAGDDASSTGAFAKERETSPLQLEREMHASAAAEVQAMGSLAGAGQLPGVPPSISAAFAKDSLEVVISQAVVESMQAVAGNISRNAASEQKPPALEDLPHGAADGAGTTTSLPADVDQARSQSSHPKRQRRQLYVPPAAQDEAAVQALKAAMRRPVAPREK